MSEYPILTNGAKYNGDVTLKAILGYGIPIFDCDLKFDHEEIDSCDIWEELWEITKSQKFEKFAKENSIHIGEWKCEDCTQMWIADAKCYVETSDFESLGQINHDTDCARRVTAAMAKLFAILKEKTGWEATYDAEPEWALHLYYN